MFILFDLAFCIASAFGSFGKDYQRIGPSIGVAIFSSVCFELPILHYLKNLTPVNSNDVPFINNNIFFFCIKFYNIILFGLYNLKISIGILLDDIPYHIIQIKRLFSFI